MEKYDLPLINFSDGLGWGAPFLWMCVNDDCPVFNKGFTHTLNNYGQTTSMRVVVEPDSGRESVAPAFTLNSEHIKTFISVRDDYKRRAQEEDLPLGDDDDADEWPDENEYDPGKGFTE